MHDTTACWQDGGECRAAQRTAWSMRAAALRRIARPLECACAVLAMGALVVQAEPAGLISAMTAAPGSEQAAPISTHTAHDPAQASTRETILGGYIGYPYHDRTDVNLQRPGGTSLTMKDLIWDAEPFKFPLYAGVRATKWSGAVGGMIDFLHDKAIARTGRGAHGAKVHGERAIPQTVVTQGTFKGAPAKPEMKTTEAVERLEFSHGHNMLMPTALVRVLSLSDRVRPYAGIGAGVAIPHVEVWPAGEGEAARTNEYQLAGTAMQIVFGIEIPLAKGPVFLEYKYTYATLSTDLTGGKTPSWCNCDFVTDFARSIARWWRGDVPALGHLGTTIIAHQAVAGAGYRLAR